MEEKVAPSATANNGGFSFETKLETVGEKTQSVSFVKNETNQRVFDTSSTTTMDEEISDSVLSRRAEGAKGISKSVGMRVRAEEGPKAHTNDFGSRHKGEERWVVISTASKRAR